MEPIVERRAYKVGDVILYEKDGGQVDECVRQPRHIVMIVGNMVLVKLPWCSSIWLTRDEFAARRPIVIGRVVRPWWLLGLIKAYRITKQESQI